MKFKTLYVGRLIRMRKSSPQEVILMDFNLTEEQELFRRTAREFCEKKLEPRAREIDEKEEIPADILKGMADLGLLGPTIPEEYGGPGGDYMMATLGAIEVARADISMATAVYYLLNAGWSFLLARHGTEEAKKEVLPKVAKSEAFLGISTTEPGGGSDIAGLKTQAKRKGNKYVLNGEKVYISGIKEALKIGGGHLTTLKTAPELGHRGLTFAYVPVNTPGISSTYFKDMGRMGISTGGIVYKDAEIPEYYRLGEENKGFYVAMEGFNAARVLVSAACIGAGEKALEIGMEYIKQRELFKIPLGKFEAIQFELADDYAKLQMVKDIVLKSAWLVEEYFKGNVPASEVTKHVAIAKMQAPFIAFDILKHTMMWHGAFGYTKDTPLEMGLRGVMSYVVGAEGGQNIMKIILGRELLGPEFIPYK